MPIPSQRFIGRNAAILNAFQADWVEQQGRWRDAREHHVACEFNDRPGRDKWGRLGLSPEQCGADHSWADITRKEGNSKYSKWRMGCIYWWKNMNVYRLCFKSCWHWLHSLKKQNCLDSSKNRIFSLNYTTSRALPSSLGTLTWKHPSINS